MAPQLRQVSRNRRNAVQQAQADDAVPGSIFDAFPAKDRPKPESKKTEPTVADLMAQLTTMQTRLDQQDRDFARAASVAPAAVAQPVNIGEEPKLDLTNLPDPVTHQQEYAAAVIQRGRKYDQDLNAYNQRKTAANTPVQLGDPAALWDDFSELHPEYAENETRIRFATAEVAARLAKRGVDVNRYMYTKPEVFFTDITKEYDKTFGSPLEQDDDQDDQGDVHVNAQEVRPRRKRAAAQDDDADLGDDGRTDGIPSGAEHAPRGQGREPADGGIIADLRAIQQKTGYF